MPISSLIVSVPLPDHAPMAAKAVNAIKGAHVELVEANRLIVLTETSDRSEDQQIWDAIGNIDHVGKIELVYHNFEDSGETSR